MLLNVVVLSRILTFALDPSNRECVLVQRPVGIDWQLERIFDTCRLGSSELSDGILPYRESDSPDMS